MTRVNPSMRLKAKADTFFLPDPNGAVYFHNNEGSFRMEGRTIHQWIEKLMPAFNGEHTLEYLTDGLPDPHRNRVYEIAEVLYENGFVRDVSQDRPHPLSTEVVQRYASQIEFFDNLVDSGAYRFASYRQTKVLAVGSGAFLASLVNALLESGMPKLRVLVTDSAPTNRQRLAELVAHARETDPEVVLEEVTLEKQGVSAWRDVVQPFDSVLYVSQEGDIEQLRALHAACRQEGKVFLPAICVQQAGIAGPLVHPDSEACWESAWRRMHQPALCKDPRLHTFSSTAGAMLANVIVFELLKNVCGVTESQSKNQFFLLNLETLEGSWHPFTPHPRVAGGTAAEWVQDLNQRLGGSSDSTEANQLLPYFSRLTSAESGLFHIWEEGQLEQLPLAQCRVQAVDPLSEGPAELLPDVVCTGMTHEEARREAGLVGIEAYVSRMVDLLVPKPWGTEGIVVEQQEFVGVGAGGTIAEGVCRGLHKCLTEELGKQRDQQNPPVFRAQLSSVHDERCRYYMQALTTLRGTPAICMGEEVSGFPVVWVGTGGQWYGSIGLNVTIALRKALQHTLQTAHGQAICSTTQIAQVPTVQWVNEEPQSLVIPNCEDTAQREVLQSALQVLKRNGRRLLVLDLSLEPLFKEELAGVFGMILREEVSR